MEEQRSLAKEPSAQARRLVRPRADGRTASVTSRTAVGLLLALGVAGVLWADGTRLEAALPGALRAVPGIQSLVHDGLLMALVSALVVGMAARDYSLIARRFGAQFSPAPFVALCVALLLMLWAGWAFMLGTFSACPAWLRQPGMTALAVLCGGGLVLLGALVLRGRPEGSVETVSLFIMGLVYIPVAFSFLGALRARWGINAAVTAVALCKGTAIGAYYAGRFIGGPRIGTRLSPAKTWAGAVGGTAAAVLMVLALEWAGFSVEWLSLPVAVLLALMVGPVAVLGDLAESLLKRQAGLKDSGNLVPGYGGMLDLVDDLLFALPFAYLFMSVAYFYA